MGTPSSGVPLTLLDLDTTLGSVYIGNVFAAFVCGITTLQTYVYFIRYPKDHVALKGIVSLLWFIDVLHVAFISHSFYIYTITNYANPLALLKIQWGIESSVLLTDVNDTIVRGVLAYRVWKLSGHNSFLAGLISIVSLIPFGVGISLFVRCHQVGEFLKLLSISWIIYLNATAMVVADVFIAAALCILLQRQDIMSRRTRSIMRSLTLYSINGSALTCIFSILSLVTYAVMPNNLVFLGIFCVLPKMYFNSLLAVLNSRKHLREMAVDPVTIVLSKSGPQNTVSDGNISALDGCVMSGTKVETIAERRYDPESHAQT